MGRGRSPSQQDLPLSRTVHQYKEAAAQGPPVWAVAVIGADGCTNLSNISLALPACSPVLSESPVPGGSGHSGGTRVWGGLLCVTSGWRTEGMW